MDIFKNMTLANTIKSCHFRICFFGFGDVYEDFALSCYNCEAIIYLGDELKTTSKNREMLPGKNKESKVVAIAKSSKCKSRF